MTILIFIICFAIAILGFTVINDRNEIIGLLTGIFAIIAAMAAFIFIIIAAFNVKQLSVIDDRIEMYQEENAQIEQQIADVVEQYQKYETDIFMEVAPESAVSMVALYPELKSDSLVQAQIEVYVANNNMIKDLKDQQIKGDVYRWWLYFGGGGD